MDKEFLKELIGTPSPAGREDLLMKKIVDYTRPYADGYLYDHQGSVTTVYQKESDFKVMLIAHADEISLIVTGYRADGSLTVGKNGGVRLQLYIGAKVRILVGEKIVHGVMGIANGALKKENPDCEDLFVDIGCSSSEEARKIVPLGSYVIHDTDLTELENNRVAARAFDDRLGVFITQSAALKASKEGTENGIYCCASTGEENTGRGAYSSSSIIKPDLAVIVDVTYATDSVGSDVPGDVRLGKGGVICLGSLPNRKLNRLLEECAKELHLPVQYEVWAGRTQTDGDTFLKTNEGKPQVLFSIPLRYMHSPVEVADYADIASMIDILALFLRKISKEEDLKPYRF